MNHAKVASRLGVSVATVSRLRSGHRIPSVATMRTIATEFDFPLSAQIEFTSPSKWAAQFDRWIRITEEREVQKRNELIDAEPV